MKRLLLVIAILLISGQAFASDQKLAHGAGTLPHLTSAITLIGGLEIPTPFLYAFRYDVGLGNRAQLGLSISLLGFLYTFEIHSMFNILKTDNDTDFFSVFLNPGIFYMREIIFDTAFIFLKPGFAYEHRFEEKHRFGFYIKVGILTMLGDIDKGGINWLSVPVFFLDSRVGYQALFGKHFSIALEPMLLLDLPALERPFLGGKVALTWHLI